MRCDTGIILTTQKPSPNHQHLEQVRSGRQENSEDLLLISFKGQQVSPHHEHGLLRQLETTNRDIVLYDINNYNSVILGMGKSNKRNISWILTGKKIEDPENLFLPINGLNLEINTWSDILTRTFT